MNTDKEMWINDETGRVVIYLVPHETTFVEAQKLATAEGVTATRLSVNPANEKNRYRTVAIDAAKLEYIPIKVEDCRDLTRADAALLTRWCDCQAEWLWDGLTLQEILNVYRVSAEWDTWVDWTEEDREAAHAAWNRAVIQFGNRMAKDEA